MSDAPVRTGSILVVEDERKTADTVALYLRHGGHRVTVVRDGAEALRRAVDEPWDLLVLDRMLPGLEGSEVLRRLREVSDVPVILLTAMSGELDRLDGFRAGADDYVVKPFSPRELVARVDALLKRAGVSGRSSRGIRVGPLLVDPEAHDARIGDTYLRLSPTEFRLLHCLADAPNRTFSRSELVDRALDGPAEERVVDTHVKNLRRKLQDAGAAPGWIATVFGRGYKLAPPPGALVSLRLRFVALVAGAVVLTVVALGLPGRRIALQEFEASVTALVEERRTDEIEAPDEPLLLEDREAFAREIRAVGPGERAVWIGPDGEVRAADDPEMEGRAGRLEADGTVLLERTTDAGVERFRLGGGRPVVGVDGADEGRVFRFPAPVGLDDRGEAFSRALDRRLLGWAALIVAAGALLALGLAGHALAPLRRLDTAARRIAAGDLGARVGGGGPPEIRKVAAAFDHMARHLEASEAARRRMIRDVAHDLRTPLTNLRGQIEALQDGLRPADSDALASLHEEAALLQRLVSDLDDLARADEGRLDLHLDDVRLDDLVAAVVDGFVQSGRLAPDRVTVDLGPAPPVVRTDRAALGRALRNVIDNVVIHAPGARMWIETVGAADPVTWVVRDDGPGIPEAHRERVTERLYRVDDARGRDTGGSGLGLAIALELVRAVGGDLCVGAAPDGGVAVAFELPRSDTGAPPVRGSGPAS